MFHSHPNNVDKLSAPTGSKLHRNFGELLVPQRKLDLSGCSLSCVLIIHHAGRLLRDINIRNSGKKLGHSGVRVIWNLQVDCVYYTAGFKAWLSPVLMLGAKKSAADSGLGMPLLSDALEAFFSSIAPVRVRALT
jgi:hypothetical protein